MRESFRQVPPPIWALVVGCVIFAVWGWLWCATEIAHKNNGDNGIAAHAQFGDAFGSLNALFTGLALAGLVYTAILQQQQIKSQEKEIHALEQSEAHRQFFQLVRLLTEEREARAAIYKLDDSRTPHFQWDTRHKEYAANVCAQFNLAGIFARNNTVIKKLVVENYRETATKLFQILQPQLDEFRRQRGSEYCKEFDWLVHEMNKRTGSGN